MLVEKKGLFPVGEVVSFRLMTGDEIVGEVVEVDGHLVGIKKPCTVGMTPQGGIGLTPAFMLANPEKPVYYVIAHIIAHMTPRADAEKSYKEFATGLALATPQQKGVILQGK